MVWSYKTKCEQHVFNTFTVDYVQLMSMIANLNPTRKLTPACLVTCTSFVWLYHLQCVRSCSREQNRVRDCCSHKHSDKHTWDLALCSLSLVPFAAAWARVRGDITCLAQGHLEHGLSWCLIFLFPYPDFFFFSFFFLPSSSLWLDHTTPRSQSGKDLLPFPTTAMTQMRLLYHCQWQLTGSASLTVVVGPWAPASVLKPRSPLNKWAHSPLLLAWEAVVQ